MLCFFLVELITEQQYQMKKKNVTLQNSAEITGKLFNFHSNGEHVCRWCSLLPKEIITSAKHPQFLRQIKQWFVFVVPHCWFPTQIFRLHALVAIKKLKVLNPIILMNRTECYDDDNHLKFSESVIILWLSLIKMKFHFGQW